MDGGGKLSTRDWMRFELHEAPWLVRALIEPTALPKSLHKLPKIAFNNLHMLGRLPAKGTVHVAGGGVSFADSVDLRNRQFIDTARAFRNEGCYEPEVSMLLDRLLPGVATFYDVGANFGYFSLRAALNPAFGGIVHAFEMSPRTFWDLRRIASNPCLGSRITAHNVGLSNRTGTQPFWQDQHSGRSKVTTSMWARQQEVRRLDDCGLPPPDVIKIDVEGHEAAVLSGAAATIAASRPAILFESWRGSADELRPFQILEPLGYQFFLPAVASGKLRLSPIRTDTRIAGSRQRNVLAITPRHQPAIAGF